MKKKEAPSPQRLYNMKNKKKKKESFKILLAKAEPTTIGSTIPRLKPMEVMIGIRINDATVWETKVAIVQQKKRTHINARNELDNGKTVKENKIKNKSIR